MKSKNDRENVWSYDRLIHETNKSYIKLLETTVRGLQQNYQVKYQEMKNSGFYDNNYEQ